MHNMMEGMGNMMGWMMGGAIIIWTAIGLLGLVVLSLLAVWLFQQVRRGSGGTTVG